jgi:hypothetical protein
MAKDSQIPLLLGRLERVEGDLVSHRAQLLDTATRYLLGVEPGVEVGSGVVAEGAGHRHMPDRDLHGSIATIALTGPVPVATPSPLQATPRQSGAPTTGS